MHRNYCDWRGGGKEGAHAVGKDGACQVRDVNESTNNDHRLKENMHIVGID